MPRPRPRTSALRAPLDFILATLGSVRTLRVLATTSVPLSQSELARRADVSPSALPALLADLENAGVVAYEGRGRTRQLVLRRRHPLMTSLGQLFREEEERWSRIQNDLRHIAFTNTPHVISAWISGPVAVRHDRFADPLVLGILSEMPVPTTPREDVRKQANIVQSKEHVIITLRFYQRADLLRFTAAQLDELNQAIVLYGPAPIDLANANARVLTTPPPLGDGSHSRKPYQGAKGLAARIADRLLKDPEVLENARTYVARRLPLAGDVERLALLEWEGLLNSLTARQIAALLHEDSERSDVLRQNMPFHGVLNDDERDALRKAAPSERRRRP